MGADNEGGDNGSGGGDEPRVPASRLREETARKREALARVGELEQQLAESEKRGATVETLTARIQELEASGKAAEASWAEERAVYQAGITDSEAIDVARHLHGRLPEKDRPAFPEWIAAQKKDPSKAPKALAAYFVDVSTEASAGGGSDSSSDSTSTRRMGADRPGSGTAPSGEGLTRDQVLSRLSKLSEAAARSGDWTAYNKERSALLGRLYEV